MHHCLTFMCETLSVIKIYTNTLVEHAVHLNLFQVVFWKRKYNARIFFKIWQKVNEICPWNYIVWVTFQIAIYQTIVTTRQIRTPVLRIPPAVTSQAKMKNWLHECQKWVSHMIGQYAHIWWGRTLIFNPMQDHDPSDISTKIFLNPLKRMRVIIRTSTDGVG